MPDEEGTSRNSSQAADVPRDAARTASELLNTDPICPGWEYATARQKSFYVRGATWFHNAVLRHTSEIAKYKPANFQAIYDRHPGFCNLDLGWNDPFSPRQAMAALSLKNREPLQLHKAVQTILLCDHILRMRVESGQSAAEIDDALRRMRIEPAVFYIQDFDNRQLEEFRKVEPNVLERLRSMTSQRSRVVFGEMAIGHTVTKELAEKTRTALINLFSGTEIGAVDNGYRSPLAAAPTEALPD